MMHCGIDIWCGVDRPAWLAGANPQFGHERVENERQADVAPWGSSSVYEAEDSLLVSHQP